MKKTYYPELDETLYTRVLENGLTVAVVPGRALPKSLPTSLQITVPFIRILSWGERSIRPLPVWLTIWSIRCSICRASGMSAPNLLPWVP